MMTSTGSEGRCDICGRSSTRDHQPPYERLTEAELQAEKDREIAREVKTGGFQPPPVRHLWEQDRPGGEGPAGDYLDHLRSIRSDPERPASMRAAAKSILFPFEYGAGKQRPKVVVVPPSPTEFESPLDREPWAAGPEFLVQAEAAERIARASEPAVNALVDALGGTRVQDCIVIEKGDTMPPIQRAWAPDYLVRAYFDQSEEWITADGRRIKIAEMLYDHALNALLFLERVQDDLPIHVDGKHVQDTPLYKAIYGRVFEKLVLSATALTETHENSPTYTQARVFLVGRNDIADYLAKVAGTDTEVIVAYKGLTDLAPKRRVVTVSRPNPGDGRRSWVVFDVDKQEPRTFLTDRIASVDGPSL
jgi:hypothetical protein